MADSPVPGGDLYVVLFSRTFASMIAEISMRSIFVWAICFLLAVGVGWSRHEKKKTRDKFLRELIAMDPVRREKILGRLRPEVAMDLRQQLMERYRISSIQSAR